MVAHKSYASSRNRVTGKTVRHKAGFVLPFTEEFCSQDLGFSVSWDVSILVSNKCIIA